MRHNPRVSLNNRCCILTYSFVETEEMKKVGMGEIIFFGVCLTKQCMIIFGMRVTGMGGGGGGRGGWGKCLI